VLAIPGSDEFPIDSPGGTALMVAAILKQSYCSSNFFFVRFGTLTV